MSGEIAAWALGGGALMVVGLGMAVAVLGVQLGRARAGQAGTAAELDRARADQRARVEERDRALAQLEDERGRAERQIADLKRDLRACDELLAENLPPAVLRERFRNLLSRGPT